MIIDPRTCYFDLKPRVLPPRPFCLSFEMGTSVSSSPALEELYATDPYLKQYESDILLRYGRFYDLYSRICESESGLEKFAKSYETYGLIQKDTGDIECLEWVPGVRSVALAGEFNNWNTETHVMAKQEFGKWYIKLPAVNGQPLIPHASEVKLFITMENGHQFWRISPWTKRAVQKIEGEDFRTLHWYPPEPYQWKNSSPAVPNGLRIYEAHVGVSSDEPKVASYTHFADNVLPRIQKLGYNCVQIMALMEHPYYASFGYHVSNFFAVSSRYGTPEELKYLIDKAHGMNLLVFLDIRHSHAAGNVNDGINQFNGTDGCFFHAGERGKHTLWDSKLFNYNEWEVLRFLVSNLCWYRNEYQLDGFRFDGITSMLYHHHGIATGFTGGYHEYFNVNVDIDAVVYLMLANHTLHSLYPGIVTVAEDVSGMPSLCRPVREGGIGFDYRLAMAIPDVWIKLLKEQRDEEWNMGTIWWALTNRRSHEKAIAYAESHDQALVGDKTLAFWLMDAEMYTNMTLLMEPTLTISRGMALHKIIRLVTFGLGGEAYLNFIGNEFGHPEWLDFPREGNGNSYHYARRQWKLVDDHLLRYQCLNEFDQDMMHLDERFKILGSPSAHVSRKHDGDKLIAFERAGLLWIFNFHPDKSFTEYQIGVEAAGIYKIALDSDRKKYDGYDRVSPDSTYPTFDCCFDMRANSLKVYIPSRCALVLYKDD